MSDARTHDEHDADGEHAAAPDREHGDAASAPAAQPRDSDADTTA